LGSSELCSSCSKNISVKLTYQAFFAAILEPNQLSSTSALCPLHVFIFIFFISFAASGGIRRKKLESGGICRWRGVRCNPREPPHAHGTAPAACRPTQPRGSVWSPRRARAAGSANFLKTAGGRWRRRRAHLHADAAVRTGRCPPARHTRRRRCPRRAIASGQR
jgi:hypothetical protein